MKLTVRKLTLGILAFTVTFILWGGTSSFAAKLATTPASLRGTWVKVDNNGEIHHVLSIKKHAVTDAYLNSQGDVALGRSWVTGRSFGKKSVLYVSCRSAAGYWTIGQIGHPQHQLKLQRVPAYKHVKIIATYSTKTKPRHTFYYESKSFSKYVQSLEK
ncbi:hypothetical protein [Levilactobacillus spicheri]|uniref:Uncharacterized protein n=1 Tax=Levilactobacillus spicheri TaxID=216463 RepID=A0A0F3RV00_9LACO|nr:hypothetical protein [Levilactobacillus spicheri]KJW13843.1 hypothetical protein VC81_01295 [Levilactobacillus spicheri]